MTKHCLNCNHHRLDVVDKGVHCQHPQRPADKGSRVVAWMKGCPQWAPEEDFLAGSSASCTIDGPCEACQ